MVSYTRRSALKKKFSMYTRGVPKYPSYKPKSKARLTALPGKSKMGRNFKAPARSFTGMRQSGKYGLRRPNMNTRFSKRVKEIVMNQVASENAYFENYIDHVTTGAEAKDAAGNQVMWGINQTAASGGLGTGTRYNLMMHNPTLLNLISQNISAVQTTKATIKSYSVHAKLVNAGTAPLTVWEYRCMARNNLSLNIDTLLSGGFSDSTTGIGTKPTATTLGATPFNNPAWCSQFKIIKVRRWELKPAQTKHIKYVNHKDYSFTQEYISPDGNIMSILKNRALSVFVCQGSFGYLSTNTDGKRFGIVTPHLGIEYQTKVHYSWINDENISQGSNVYSTGLTAGTPGAGAHVPAPIVINHPDSSVTAGTRAYASTDAYSMEALPFNIN